MADFEAHLDLLPSGRRRLVAFLGGTIGNLVPEQRSRFLAGVAAILGPGDAFLLGTIHIDNLPSYRSAIASGRIDVASAGWKYPSAIPAAMPTRTWT